MTDPQPRPTYADSAAGAVEMIGRALAQRREICDDCYSRIAAAPDGPDGVGVRIHTHDGRTVTGDYPTNGPELIATLAESLHRCRLDETVDDVLDRIPDDGRWDSGDDLRLRDGAGATATLTRQGPGKRITLRLPGEPPMVSPDEDDSHHPEDSPWDRLRTALGDWLQTAITKGEPWSEMPNPATGIPATRLPGRTETGEPPPAQHP